MRALLGIRAFITSILFIIIGIFLIVSFSGELADNAKTPYNYDDLRYSDYKEGMMV